MLLNHPWNSRRSSLDFLPAFPLAGDQRSILSISRLTHLSVLSKPSELYHTYNHLFLWACSRCWDFVAVKTMPAVAFTAHFVPKSCRFSLEHLVSLYTFDSVDYFIALPRPAFVKSWFYKYISSSITFVLSLHSLQSSSLIIWCHCRLHYIKIW